ncbi:MAG: HepT-like ribonuclease domain-containing protein [Acidobacteriota bacterium]
MLEAVRKSREFAQGRRREDLDNDEQLSLALQRLLEVLGEAASKVTLEGRQLAPEIPWRAISGMRNRLIHAYFDVDLDIVWRTISDELPPLEGVLEALLTSVDKE